MAFRDLLSTFSRSRRLLRAVDRIASAQEQQAHQLQRLADHFLGPEQATPSDEDIRIHSGVSFAKDREQGLIVEFIEKTLRDTGREPTEDEVLRFLEGTPV